MTKRKSDSTRLNPGAFILEEMQARGWTEDDLAKQGLLIPTSIRELISGHRKITPVFAMGLAQAFGTSRELWDNLQQSYDEGKPEFVSMPPNKRTISG